jgi:hypothetical protein
MPVAISGGPGEKNGPSIAPDALHDFVRGFQNDQLLIVGQRDERVRRAFNLLDQVAVQDD